MVPNIFKAFLLVIITASLSLYTYAQEPQGFYFESTPIKGYTHNQLKDEQTVARLFNSAVTLYKEKSSEAFPLFYGLFQVSIHNRFDTISDNAYSFLITICDNKGDYDKSYVIMHAALKIAQTRNITRLYPPVYNTFGNWYQRAGQYDSSLYYYYRSIDAAERYAPEILPGIYSNLSGVLESMGEYEKGLAYINKAEVLLKQNDHYYNLCLTLINKGNALCNLQRYQEAIICLTEAVGIAEKHNYTQWKHLALSNLGSTYINREDYNTALIYLKQAEQMEHEIDPNYIATNWSLLSSVYYKLKNYKKAEWYSLQCLQYAKGHNISRSILESLLFLGRINAATGYFEKAYQYNNEYAILKDSVLNEDIIKQNNVLEIKYRTSAKDKELAENKLIISKKQNQIKSRNFWIAIISFASMFLAALVSLMYSLYKNSKHQKLIQEEKLKNILREQELLQASAIMAGEEKSRNQIARDLHDGIGCMLASIKMNLSSLKKEYPQLAGTESIHRLSDIVSDTAVEVRRTAHNLMPDIIERHGLKAALMQYMDNNNTHALRIHLQFDNITIIPKAGELFIYRIIQELIQNIVKHAKASNAYMQVMEQDDNLCLSIEDDGTGFDAGNENNAGMGLKNIQLKVVSLGGYFSVSSSDDGTVVFMEIPLTKLTNFS